GQRLWRCGRLNAGLAPGWKRLDEYLPPVRRRRSTAADQLVMVGAGAEHGVGGEDPLEVVTDAELVGHAHAAVRLDRRLAQLAAVTADERLEDRDVARTVRAALDQGGRVHERGPGPLV